MSDGLLLTGADRLLLDGSDGPASALAMRVVVAMARLSGARELVDITGAHIDACLFHGYAGLHFAERLVAGGGRVRVPTTLNVSSLDLLHPDRFRGDAQTADAARRLMDAYVALGGRPTWTCAPYQLAARPGLGEQVAWAESNAIVFANSVLGARTGRYGDFLDIAAALTGRAPLAGLHLTEHRRGRVVFDVTDVPAALLHEAAAYPLLGHVVGQRTAGLVPVIAGLPSGVDEDRLKALGAAAASAGSVAMFHAVGCTPEAPTLPAALHGAPPDRVERLGAADLRAARAELSSRSERPFVGVNLGTPHFSVSEFAELVPLLRGRQVHPDIEFYVSTGRDVLAEVQRRGWLAEVERAGVRVVTDTCTYITPVLRNTDGRVLTNSGKWAYYAPGNLGVDVLFASLRECVDSAVAGTVVEDHRLWGDEPPRGASTDAPAGSRRQFPADEPAGPGMVEGPARDDEPRARVRVLVDGTAAGDVLSLDAPLSFWGGVDAYTGRIIDVHHPQAGATITRRVLVLPAGRGSSSSSSVLAEAIRLGNGPAAILMGEADEILVLGALVAAELYGTVCPMLEVPPDVRAGLRTGETVSVEPGGSLHRDQS